MVINSTSRVKRNGKKVKKMKQLGWDYYYYYPNILKIKTPFLYNNLCFIILNCSKLKIKFKIDLTWQAFAN